MDPKACVERIQGAIDSCDVTEARYALADLQRWIVNGGFKPEIECVYVPQHAIARDALEKVARETAKLSGAVVRFADSRAND